ncbi:MAG: bifunctional UDP-N-acetylglucosamine diphosphorylase/glucosamine-1-phosphate N-acetyltransferase GlmU [Panacagrimonas sp.]
MATHRRTRPVPSPLHVVILAAGQGTRMKSALPKVLHPIAGRPMLDHVLKTAHKLGAVACHVVVGHGGETIRAWVAGTHAGDGRLHFAVQAEQLGTAHAVLQAMPQIPDAARVLILYGDVPLIQDTTLTDLLVAASAGLAVLTAEVPDPSGYGRIVRNRSRAVQRIVEEKDATPAQRRIREINTGVMAAPAALLRRWLGRIGNKNAKTEFYLTDAVGLAVSDRASVKTVRAGSAEEVLGVNDRVQLATQERAFQRRQAEALMHRGVGIRDANRFDLRGSLLCGQDVHLDVGVIVEGEVELGDHVHIGPYTLLKNAKIGAGTHVEGHCVIDSALIGRACRIGPFARLRPEAQLADQVHIGNFVEIKKSTLGEAAKANHLAYIGDAAVGARVNIGAGVITCNYDGVNKHRTVIGDDAFIGTDTQLIAPVTIGAGAYIAAGSSISMDAPPDQLTICRSREQRSLAGWKRPAKRGEV